MSDCISKCCSANLTACQHLQVIDVEGSQRSSPNIFDVSPTEGRPTPPENCPCTGKDPVGDLTEVLIEVSNLYPTIPQSLPVDRGLSAWADQGRLESDPSGKLARAEWGTCVIFPDRLSGRIN